MKKIYFAAASLVICGAMSGTYTGAQTQADQKPSGTIVDKQHAGNDEVQPAPENIRITPSLVSDAQQKLNDEGYRSGTVDGKLGPVTGAAIRKYQQDKGIKVTGTLDESTLSHLNIGEGKVMATAPGDVGRGAKAAGHNVKEGHPVAAAKALGTIDPELYHPA
jgi:peptidoglycan hydrolase-like protein with peptidoglycan-binding domain